MNRRRHHARRWPWLLLGALAVAYFILITSSAARGTELRHLSQDQNALQRETRALELHIADESSGARLRERVHELGLHPATRVEYASAPLPDVARR